MKITATRGKFVAIVLAGDRTPHDPVAVDAGVSCKAIAEIAGKPMIMRVIDALQDSGVVSAILLCGPKPESLQDCPQLLTRLEHESISWIANLDSPSRSVDAALERIDESAPVLLTTADHALLRGDIVEFFISRCVQQRADACVGLLDYRTINEAYPEVKRTVIRLSDGGYCGCNLFAFMNAKGRKLVPFWRKVEQQRKTPAKMIAGILGPVGVLRYFLHCLRLDSALAKVSRRLQIDIQPVILPFAQAGIDVDTVQDRHFAEKLLGEESR